MPGWHKKTKALVEAGDLKVAGIVQEQHPERAKLYMQWQEMDWPVLADPFNELGIKAVPITLLIDESGIVRYKNPKGIELEDFLKTKYPKEVEVAEKVATSLKTIEELEQVLDSAPDDAAAHFRLGVAYRQRFDSEERKDGDFAKAVSSWKRALALDPNQYIWRRRIQQYGPRLDKPYSFYDWVNKARKEIKARGEMPHSLVAEPSGSEFAYPEKAGGVTAGPGPHPDPDGKVARDKGEFVSVQTVVVPSTKGARKALRVHLRFRPRRDPSVHWTNDAGKLSFFPEALAGLSVHDWKLVGKTPATEVSDEERLIEFEVRSKEGSEMPESLNGAAFYYVCEEAGGVCHYRRQDIVIPLSEK